MSDLEIATKIALPTTGYLDLVAIRERGDRFLWLAAIVSHIVLPKLDFTTLFFFKTGVVEIFELG
jgi:hypothetical protein